MEMTHPDILKMERYGTLHPEKDDHIGYCETCGEEIVEGYEYLRQDLDDGQTVYFCGRKCALEYHGIEEY